MVRVPWRDGWSAAAGVVLSFAAWAGPVDDAQRAYDEGDYTHAVDLYEQALVQNPGLANDASFAAAMWRAEARVAYNVGSRLHGEGEYEAAAEQFLDAIAKDSGFVLALAALDDAQHAAVRQRLRRAVEAADAGDLLGAKQHLERSLLHGGGADTQIITALSSILAPNESFDQDELDRLEEARRLGRDLQWGLAEQVLADLVVAHPLLMPARAEQARVTKMKAMSVALTDDAAALIQQKRLSPAREKLAAAASVWPYNARAAELLETVEASVHRADEAVAKAQTLLDEERWRAAYDQITAALAIDPSHAEARAVRSAVRIGLVQQLGTEMRSALNQQDHTRARALVDQADRVWPNNRWTRVAYADFHTTLGKIAEEDGRDGAAYLRYVLASRHNKAASLKSLEDHFVQRAGASFVIDMPTHSPSIGVTSTQLANELLHQRQASNTPAVCQAVLHSGFMNEHTEDPAYAISIDITETDIELRQRESRSLGVTGNTFGQTTRASIAGNSYWEKYGTVACSVQIIDTATEQTVATWTASRWANYTDRQQYQVGRTWNANYWTLPTDDAIEGRLARDLAADLWPDIREAVTLDRARALLEQAESLKASDPDASRSLYVQAVVLAGQINPREARQELRHLARQLDQAMPAGQPANTAPAE